MAEVITKALYVFPISDKLLEVARAQATTHSLVGIEDMGVATPHETTNAVCQITGNIFYIDGTGTGWR